MSRFFQLASLIVILSISVSTSHGADWPTYLGDNARTGATAESLTMPLKASWEFVSSSAPRRAWSGPEGRVVENKELRDRVKFDDALDVAVVGSRVYFGSSVDHQVRCMDLATGKILWSFFTGGSVRLAPTVAEGRVYAGSDDGYAYCLDAESGSLIWKLRAGPADEWLIARGEMCSRWPVRTGILVDDGVAYFGAGIFPHENVYLCAANAADGSIIWRNDNISHQDAGRNDLSPQGYLLATESLLHVPSGRSRPKSVNRGTGKLTGSGTTSLKLSETIIAGTDALVVDGRLYMYSLGTRLAVLGDESLAATGKEVMRMNRKQFDGANSRRLKISSQLRTLSRSLRGAGDKAAGIKAEIAKLQQELKDTANLGVVWRTPCTAEGALIVTKTHVFAGDKGRVTAFDFETGKEVWTAAVDGTARGLAAANGNLLVSTTTGRIYCFADATQTASGAKDQITAKTSDNPFKNDQWTAIYKKAADDILKQTGVTQGFCLVVGNEQARLAYELAKRSELKIYASESDEKKVDQARRALSAAGMYGNRITIHQADLSNLPYSNYFANLIVSDTLLVSGKIPATPGASAKHLKPAGGVIALGRPADAPGTSASGDEIKNWLADMKLGDGSKVKSDSQWVTLTRGTLPGAGNWSHQYGEPGNTANSGDKIVTGGMGVLWYGDPGPGQMVNRHQGAVGPLVVNGRIFVQGENTLMAYDAYNGLFLWEVENPKAIRTGVFRNLNPGNLAASDDSLFHMVREKVYEHDMATGEVKREHELPPSVDGKTHEWGYVAYRDGRLYGTATTRGEVVELNRRGRGNPGPAATDSVFAIDVSNGKHLWTHQGKSIDFQTIALGPDRIFFIDSSVTSEQRDDILRQDKSELKDLKGADRERAEARLKKLDVRLAVALDGPTGRELWSKPVDVTDCSEIGIGGGKLTMMYSDGTLMLCGANANGHYWRQFVGGEFSRRRLVALNSLDGYKLWSKDANYRHRPIIVGKQVIAEPWSFDVRSGKQQTRIHPLTGKEVPWSIMRPGHHCGMLTASDNLLLFRSGYTGFFDLNADAGTRHFAGHRLGCWINAIPTNGLVVVPEASAGCVCMFSIASTIVMEPREARRPWTLYSGVGATTPVKQMSLNFGAPGDRRDEHGKLWLTYPRTTPNSRLETSLDLKLKLETKFAPGGKFFSADGDTTESSSSELNWVVSSGARGLARCSIPLLGKDDPPARYSVRLVFAAPGESGAAVFDVQMNGKPTLARVNLADEAKAGGNSVILTVKDVPVEQNLEIEFVLKNKSAELAVLSGIEVKQER